MTITFYRPQKYVQEICDHFVTTLNDEATALKVYDVDAVYITRGTMIMTGTEKDMQAILDTRLFTYFDIV